MKRKMIISFLTGLVAVCGLNTGTLVHAAEPMEIIAVDSAFIDGVLITRTEESEPEKESFEESVLLSVHETGEDAEAVEVSPENKESSSEEEKLPSDESPISDTEAVPASISEEVTETENPAGTLFIKADKDEITSLDKKESFSFAYSGTKKDDTSVSDPSKLQIQLDKGFILKQLNTGKWSGTDEEVQVSFVDPKGTVLGTITFLQDQLVDAASFATAERIFLVTDSYSDSVQGILLEGKMDENSCKDSYVIKATYGALDDREIYAEADTSVSTKYMTLPLPALSSNSKDLYTGSVSEIQMGEYSSDRDVEEMTIQITIPEGQRLTCLKAPAFDHADTSVFVDGEELSEGSLQDSGKAASIVEIKVKPDKGAVIQMDSLSLFLRNELEDEGVSRITSKAEFLFSDGTRKAFDLRNLDFELKGMYAAPSEDENPEQGTEEDPADNPEVNPDEEPSEEETAESEEKEPDEKDNEEEKPIQIIQVIDRAGIGDRILLATADSGADLYNLLNPDSEEDTSLFESAREKLTEKIRDVSEEYKDKKKTSVKEKTEDHKKNASSGNTENKNETGRNIYHENVLIPAAVIAGALIALRILLSVLGRIRKRKEDPDDEKN